MMQTWAAAFHICWVSCLPSMLVLKMCDIFHIRYNIYIYIHILIIDTHSVFSCSSSRTFSRHLAQFLGQSQTGAGPFPSFAKPTENLPPVTRQNSWTWYGGVLKCCYPRSPWVSILNWKSCAVFFWVPHDGTPILGTPHMEMCHNQHHSAMP